MSWSVVESRTLSEEPQVSLSDEVRYSTMKELNSLNEEVRSLKKDLFIAQRISLEWSVPAIYTYAPFYLPPVKPISHLLSIFQPSMPQNWAFPGR